MFCFHRWTITKSHKSFDMSFGKPGMANTCILSRCRKCGKYKSYYIDGHWVIEVEA